MSMSNQTVIVEEAAPKGCDRIESDRLTIELTFPCDVKQVDRNRVCIELSPSQVAMFSAQFMDMVTDDMGDIAGRKFLSDILNYAAGQFILRNTIAR
jgi:hypothetical protein